MSLRRRTPTPLSARGLRPAAAALALAVLVTVAGCGGGGEEVLAPREVPVKAIPATLPDPTDADDPFTLVEYPAARKQFAEAGERTLVDDGRMWELRRGSVLVGTLEVGALKRKVDLSKADHRKKMIALMIPGAFTTLKIQGVSVVRSVSDDKTTYLVFGDGIFELLDIKGASVEPEQVLRSLLAFQVPTGTLRLTTATTRRNPLE